MRLLRTTGATALIVAAAAYASPVAAQKAPPAGQAGTARSVAAGVFTAKQAAHGETVFRTVCGNCHTTSEFASATFRKTWSDRPVYSFFDQLRNAMPLDNPGGLSRAEYTAVIAYILKLNTYPAGQTELPQEDAPLKQIRFASHPGSTD